MGFCGRVTFVDRSLLVVKFKKVEKLKESKNFSFFIIQHDSKIRDTGNRFKIDSGFSCNFGRHKSECACIHEILSLLFKI